MPNTIYTYQPINPVECMGDSLFKINNNNFLADNAIGVLETRINTLSSLMNQIMNVPYIEFAWVTTPNTAGQVVAANTITTLYMGTEIVDLGGHGSLTPGSAPPAAATSQVTLAAGTYSYIVRTGWDFSSAGGSNAMAIGLYNITETKYVSRTGPEHTPTSGDYAFFRLEGQFTITTSTIFDIRCWCSAGAIVRNSGGDNMPDSGAGTTADADQRTTLQLWKIG